MRGAWFFLVALIGLVGCQQQTQRLPFDVAAPASGTVTSAGGVVSTPAGAALHFPAGSVASPLSVSIVPVAMPAESGRSGHPVSAAFRLEPAGAVLTRPAELELKLSAGVGSAAWLASVVHVVDGGVEEIGSARVDLSTGVVAASIGRLGTVTLVIPEPAAVHVVRRRGTQAAEPIAAPSDVPLLASDSVSVRCGEAGERCAGLEVEASGVLLDQVEDAAVVYPRFEGALQLSGVGASGLIRATASLRVKLQSGQTAETLEVIATLEPTPQTIVVETASELTLTHVRHRISGTLEGGSEEEEEIRTLVIPKTVDGGLLTIQRVFRIRTSGGSLEPAEVSLAVPVQIHS
jgi:hypothetical protein